MAAKASGVLTLDTAPFIKSLEAAKVALKGFAVAVAGIALAAVAGFAVLGVGVFKIVSIFKEGVLAAFAFGREMNAATRQMQGVGVGNFFLIQKALEKSGMSADEARSSIKEMSETGMSWSALWKTPANAARAIAEAKADFGPMASALSKGAVAIHDIRNSMDALSSKFTAFFQSFVAQFVDPLSFLLKSLKNAFDFSQISEGLGKIVGALLDQIIGGILSKEILKVLAAQLKLLLLDAQTLLTEAFTKASEGLSFIKEFSYVFKAGGNLLMALLLSVFHEGANIFSDVLSASWKLFAKIMGEVAPKLFGKTGEYNEAINQVKYKAVGIQITEDRIKYDKKNYGANYEGSDAEKLNTAVLKQKLAEMKDLKGIRNYEAGQAELNTPSQTRAVNEYLQEKSLSKEKPRQIVREADTKRIDDTTKALLDAGLKAGGTLGQVAIKLARAGEGFAMTKEQAIDYLKNMSGLGATVRSLMASQSPTLKDTAPPILPGKPFEAMTTSLGKIGGGGGSFLTSQTAQEQRQQQALKNGYEANLLLTKVIINTDPENPKAGAKGPVMLP